MTCFYDVRNICADTKQGYVVTNEPPRSFGSPAQGNEHGDPAVMIITHLGSPTTSW